MDKGKEPYNADAIRREGLAMCKEIAQGLGVDMPEDLSELPDPIGLTPSRFAVKVAQYFDEKARQQVIADLAPDETGQGEEQSEEGESQFYVENVKGKTPGQLLADASSDFRRRYVDGEE